MRGSERRGAGVLLQGTLPDRHRGTPRRRDARAARPGSDYPLVQMAAGRFSDADGWDTHGPTVSGSRARARARLSPGATIGRYVVLDELGAGGMGVVYKAYDPELERPIALKLLHEEGRSGAFRERLLREAQALARLSHPHVVAIHDVGTFGESVFIAMEFVEGKTLRQWLQAEPRSRRAILDIFLAAGEGLAAAHAAGLIHRDFKPDNVMVGDDGRVRVFDFGLARAADSAAASSSALASRPPRAAGASEAPPGGLEASDAATTR